MSAQHAQGRMTHTSAHVIKLPDGYGALADNSAIASRLAACWNRLELFTTEQIEDFSYDLFAEQRPQFDRLAADLRAMQKQRNELLEAMKDLIAGYENTEHTGLMDMQVCGSDIIKARAIIAKLTVVAK